MRLLSLLFNLAFPLILIAGLFAQEESDRLEAALSRARGHIAHLRDKND